MKRLLNGKGRKRETGDLRLETGDEMKESCAAWSAAGRLENLGASKILARHGSMVALRLHGSACAGMAVHFGFRGAFMIEVPSNYSILNTIYQPQPPLAPPFLRRRRGSGFLTG